MKNKLKVLKAQRNKLYKQAHSLDVEICQLENDLQRPILQEKYAGKYFRIPEGYGRRPDSPKWFIYFKVDQAEPDYEARGWSFQKNTFGRIEVELEESFPYDMLKEEISEGEFLAEYKQLLTELNSLRPIVE